MQSVHHPSGTWTTPSCQCSSSLIGHHFTGVICQKKTNVFCLAQNFFSFQSMHLAVLFATSLINLLVSQVFSVWSWLGDHYQVSSSVYLE